MQTLEAENNSAADLHWLVFLLTGCRDISIDVAVETAAFDESEVPSFSKWMLAWSRRLAISKALTAIREELAASVRRFTSKRAHKPALPDRDWALDGKTSRADLESALLGIDTFPRAALVLSIFEGVPVEDAAVLLDAEPSAVRSARSIGLGQLTAALARMQGWTSKAIDPPVLPNETQYA